MTGSGDNAVHIVLFFCFYSWFY